jgi:sterol 3beta-glucosyltransferase
VLDDAVEDSEESWTFIGDDNDPELVKRIHDWEMMAQSSTRAGRDSLGNRALRTGSGTGSGSGIPATRTTV